MSRAYRRCWITCLPAVQEAFGLVIVESLASGRPSVAIRDGGVPEILGSGPGAAWLAEPDDPDSLASAITAALSFSERPEAAEVCRRMAAPFDWSVRGPELVALYRRLLLS
jgi:glycosyltransferase involved in cell wall biosynthesis